MKVWFAIKENEWESETVFGPFDKRRTAADFIEKDEDMNEYAPWWRDNWYIGEYEVTDKWDEASSLCPNNSKPYRPAYCKEQRKIEYEKRREEHPEQALIDDNWVARFRDAIANPPKPTDILDNLQFGQEIEVKIPKNDIIKIDN